MVGKSQNAPIARAEYCRIFAFSACGLRLGSTKPRCLCYVVAGVEDGDSKRINNLLKLNWESSEVNQKRIGAGESRQDIYRNDISLVELFAACLSI